MNPIPYDALDDSHHHVVTDDAEIQLMLLHLGMSGVIPPPPCGGAPGQCGHALYQDHTEKFYLIVIRACTACGNANDGAYSALLLSKRIISVKEAFEIRDNWLERIANGRKMELRDLEFPAHDRN